MKILSKTKINPGHHSDIEEAGFDFVLLIVEKFGERRFKLCTLIANHSTARSDIFTRVARNSLLQCHFG